MSESLPDLPGIVKVHFMWSDSGGRYGSRLFWNCGTGPFPSGDLHTWLTTISTAWGANLKAYVQQGISLVQLDAVDLTSKTSAVSQWTGSITGTLIQTMIPSSATVNIRSILHDRYRGGHPVFHHPGGGATSLADTRHWTGAFVGPIAAAMQAFMTQVEASPPASMTSPIQVVPRNWKPGVPTSAVELAQVTGFLVPTQIGTMRSRLTSTT